MSVNPPSAPRLPSRLTDRDLGDGGLHDELVLDAVRLTGSADDEGDG